MTPTVTTAPAPVTPDPTVPAVDPGHPPAHTGSLFTETVPGAFARTVAAHADRTAVTGPSTSWTYRELDHLAGGIAAALRARGLAPGERVGVHVARCPELYPLFLGILRAALAVVPFNPDHPAGHVRRMHAVAAPALTVADDTGAPGVAEASTVALADLLVEARAAAGAPGGPGPGPEDPAFVLFTSGSTGTPKGVEIVHRGLARVARGLTGYTPGPGDVFLQLAQPSFAASTTDIWTCLLRGARLVVAPQQVPEPAGLARLAAAEGVTVLNLPVGLFNRLVDQQSEMLGRARWVIVSGDFPSAAHLRRGLEVTGGTLFNAFGCTENSALTAVHEITARDLEDEAGAVPVGRPMPAVAMSVRDERLREVPPGETGELCLAGAGLARGYLGDPELTAAKFVEHDGQRLLRTGDLARRLADGAVVLAGRTDQMVKVRGFRVEPRQVELAAEAVPGVGRALVQAAPASGAAEALVLWFTARDAGADAAALRQATVAALRAELPDHMVPTHVCPLDAFPLNANGKIDREALAELFAASPEPGAGAGPAGSGDELADTVRELLAEVTGLADLGADDGLLDSGVTSLHLIDLGARLEDAAGAVLAPDDLVAAGSARGIAERIRTDREES